MKIRNIAKLTLPVIATIGFVAALRGSISPVENTKPLIAQTQTADPAIPYEAFVVGPGIVEPYNRSVDVATQISGVIEKVAVKIGQQVAKGDVLFVLDSREVAADLAVKEASLKLAEFRLEEAQVSLDDALLQLKVINSLADKRAVSAEERTKRQTAVASYKAKKKTAQAEIVSAQASVNAASISLSLRTILSPVDGQVLQLNARPGQLAMSSDSAGLAVIGNTTKLSVKMDIDENEAWRVSEGQPGWAYMKGNRKLAFKLEFDHIEPFVRPKQSLTGESSERTDTRVLQVIFKFDQPDFKIYVGQQVEIYMRTGSMSKIKTDGDDKIDVSSR
jgi:HlyD family secretion protein